MIDSRFDGPELSGEEIRELLRDDLLEAETPAEGRPAPGGAGLRNILLVARRKDDLELFRSRLEAHGAAVTIVKNPFTALDQIRRAVFEGVVTDLDLWANDGELLLDRVRPRDTRLPLLLIADRSRDEDGRLESRLREAGAMEIVFRPLRAAEVERAALNLVGVVGVPAETSMDAGAEEGSTGAHPAGASAGLLGIEAPVGELLWLRFFFHAQRAVRAGTEPLLCLRAVLDAALEHLAPRSAAFFVADDARRFALIVGPSGADPDALLAEAGALLAEAGAFLAEAGSPSGHASTSSTASLVIRGDSRGSEGAKGSEDAKGSKGTGPRLTLVLGGLPDHVRASSSSFVEDLRRLAADAFRRDL